MTQVNEKCFTDWVNCIPFLRKKLAII